MKTEAIVLVAGLLSWWVASKQSLSAAFLQVYLPVFLIIPSYYVLPIDSFPDPSFVQCAILPIGIGLTWKAFVKREWNVSFLDFTVIAFLVWEVVSEVYNTGFTKVPDLVFDVLTLGLWPYMAGKTLVEQTGLRTAFARRIVWCIFIVCVISVYEFRMGNSLFRPALGMFFPDQNPEWVTQLRWGYGRIAGPYGHAITMGLFVGAAYLMHRWLCQSGQWQPKFKGMASLPFSKSTILTAGLLLGLFMTLSRGPWLGMIVGAILAGVGLRRDRSRALRNALLTLVIGGAILYMAGKAYLNGVSAFEGAEEQASAAYRAILVSQYEDIVMLNPVFGWGRANWPQVEGMKSIDNNYLFVALSFGLVGLGLFCVMSLTELWRIFQAGYFSRNLAPDELGFRFMMAGVLVSIAFSTGTTYIGAQTYPLFFMLLGWSEAVVISVPALARVSSREPAADYRMTMRVVA